MQRRIRTKSQRKPGQALVEMALIVATVGTLLLAAVDLGRAFSAWIAMGNMARAGAQYGSMAASFGTITPATLRSDIIKVTKEEQSKIFGRSPSRICAQFLDTYTDPNGRKTWDVQVSVEYKFKPIIGVVSEQTLTRDAKMRMQWIPANIARGTTCSP